MEQKEQEELEREVQAVYSEKAQDLQVQTNSSQPHELSDDDLEQMSGGLNSYTSDISNIWRAA